MHQCFRLAILWSQVPSDSKRTNNGPESFHAHYNEQFCSSHPTIYLFIDNIIKFQTTAYIKMRSIDEVPSPPIQRLPSLANRRGIEINYSLEWVKNSGAQMGYGVFFIFSLKCPPPIQLMQRLTFVAELFFNQCIN